MFKAEGDYCLLSDKESRVLAREANGRVKFWRMSGACNDQSYCRDASIIVRYAIDILADDLTSKITDEKKALYRRMLTEHQAVVHDGHATDTDALFEENRDLGRKLWG